jgi:hypothetical protein
MFPEQNVPLTVASNGVARPLGTLCLITLDREFIDREVGLLHWVHLVIRDSYKNVAGWCRKNKIIALVLELWRLI